LKERGQKIFLSGGVGVSLKNGIEKPDRSWGVGGLGGKARSEVIKVIHPESEGCKIESLFFRFIPNAASGSGFFSTPCFFEGCQQ